ncbi:MAG TPA: tRNA (adenosine(37)-N6)-dimethylallyltransferase MiaA [Acidimicrobiales bacterium]|nr:tRNA (adenosine(37)-N6)-dimethylallyltransferase MiaA [Acidimicrobiales bacterium]
MPYKVASGRLRPTAASRNVTSSAGECGGKDQVSRSRLSGAVHLDREARHLSVVGATATGKTAAAVRYARRHAGVELVSVDAIAVYRGLDIGTAKPTPDERRDVTWHLLDVCDPGEEFSVARFQRHARAAVAGIEGRGHRVVLVGGTGLYHRALVDELALPGRYPEVAAALETEADGPDGLAGLYARLVVLDPTAATRVSPTNRRRLVRALEVVIGSGRPFSAAGPGLGHYGPTRFCLVGLTLPRDELDRRIAARLEAQFAAGFVDEVAALVTREGGLSRTARQALGYRELIEHVAGDMTLEEARAAILRRTRAFARRQESWFRRDPRIVWLEAQRRDFDEALDALAGTAGRAGDPARD